TIDEVNPGAAIHPRGADAAAGRVVLATGTVLGPHHLGIAATVGARELVVSRKPRVVVLSSGDEVRPPEVPTRDLTPQQIRNSNGPMLVAMLRAMGAERVRHEHVVDKADAVRAACVSAAADADLVVTAGGVSVGQRDLFPTMWPTLGYETVLHGVAMQPGKPVLVARKNVQASAKPQAACVVGLPGNPVSVWATAHLFLWPMVLKMLGLGREISEGFGSSGGSGGGLPWRRVWLASPAKGNAKREAFRAARLIGETREQVEVVAWQGSGDLMHTATADGLVRMPIHGSELPAGSPITFLPILGSGWGG
ncbi:MAG: molybdopterin molybdotransferase MoeA, partial [Planctomycetota bacterium]